MHHLSRALATARIDDLLRDGAQMHMIRLARRVTHEAHVAASNVADNDAIAGVAPVAYAHVNSLGRYDLNRQPPARVNSGRYAWSRTSPELARRRR